MPRSNDTFVGTPIVSTPAIASSLEADNDSRMPSPPSQRPRLEFITDFTPSDQDIMLEEYRKERDNLPNSPLHNWISSAIKFREISHEDLRRMSLCSNSSSAHTPTDQSLSRSSAGTNEYITISIPQENSTLPEYATIHLYEISAFDLPPGEAEEIVSSCSCLSFLFRRSANSSVPASPSGSGSPQLNRDIICELSIVDAPEGDEKTAAFHLKSSEEILASPQTQTKSTSVQNGTLSPSWKVQGLTGPNIAKRRPKRPIVSFNVAFSQILASALRIKFIDYKTKEVLGWIDFELQRLFESTYGTQTIQHSKPIRIPDKLLLRVQENEIARKGATVSPVSVRPINSAESIELKEKYSDDSKGGRVRIRAAALSDGYLLDLLRGPDEELIFSGLNIAFKLVQFCDLQQLCTTNVDIVDDTSISPPALSAEADQSRSTPISKDEVYHPLAHLLFPRNFQYLFSTLTILEEHPKYVNNPDLLLTTRKKVASLLTMIFHAGIQRFGAVFSSAFENFGDQLAQFTDVEKFEDEIVLSFIDLINQVPLRTKLEAAVCNDGKLLNTLLDFCNIERMEDVQTKALSMINSLIDQLKDFGHWRAELLSRISAIGIEGYLCEQIESWHPSVAEESLILLGHLLENNAIELSDPIREGLRHIEEENISSKQGKIAQRVLFNVDFKLQLLPFDLIWSSCSSRLIYKLSNICHQDTGMAHTPRGVYKDVDLLFEFPNGPVILSHIAGVVPLHTSNHAATSMIFFVSMEKPSKGAIDEMNKRNFGELLEAIEDRSRQWNASDLIPCGYLEFKTEAYMEAPLGSATQAQYMLVRLNSDNRFNSKSHIEVDYVAAVGYPSKDFDFKRRNHNELLGEVGVHVGMKIPKKPNSNLIALMNSPEMMRNLPS